jgi:NADPH:quinone reductase-like Zn-dependent oxidoreductase
LLAVGFASGEWGQADSRLLVNRNCAVLGVYVGAYDHEQVGSFHQQLLDLHGRGLIDVPLAGEVAFDELPAGLGRLQRREVQGKLVVRMP